jgi:hypothetical protein
MVMVLSQQLAIGDFCELVRSCVGEDDPLLEVVAARVSENMDNVGVPSAQECEMNLQTRH